MKTLPFQEVSQSASIICLKSGEDNCFRDFPRNFGRFIRRWQSCEGLHTKDMDESVEKFRREEKKPDHPITTNQQARGHRMMQ